MSKMETGTLKDLNVRPGDMVECVNAGGSAFVRGAVYECVKGRDGWGNEAVGPLNPSGRCIPTDKSTTVFRIVSRASATPKLWRDMTDAEKGALLLAHHEGRVIEVWASDRWVADPVAFHDKFAYRVRPEPKRETVTLRGGDFGRNGAIAWSFLHSGHISPYTISPDTHRITFDLIDGKPDPTSIRMEELS